jgi:hypothetical protein
VSSNQVETIRPRGISSFRLVRDAVQKGRDADTQFPDAGGSHFITLAICSWGRQYHAIPDIRSKLPKVRRMRFLYIHDMKCDAIPIRIVELVESGNLPPKGWSSVAAKHQYDWTLPKLGGELHNPTPVERRQREVRSSVSNPHIASARRHPKRLKRKNHHGRHRELRHDQAKCFGWLAHRGVQTCDYEAINQRHCAQSAADDFYYYY